MSIKCTHKDENGHVCGHINADGNSYCVKCGHLLEGSREKKVVIKDDYDKFSDRIKKLEREIKQLEDRIYTLKITDEARVEQIKRQQNRLYDIDKNGSAPEGYTLISNKALKDERDKSAVRILTLKEQLDDLKTKGYAPSGFHLEKNLSWIEEVRKKSEYTSLLRRANQSWWEKLKETIKKWWDDSGAFSVIVWLIIIFGGGFIGILIHGLVSSCSNDDNTIVKIEQRDGLWGIAKGNDVILPFEYDSIVSDKYDTIYSRIYKDENVGLVKNTTGKVIVPSIYRSIGTREDVSLNGKLIAAQQSDGKWTFVDYSGSSTGLEFDYAEWWDDAELGKVGRIIDGEMKYGYVDSLGIIKIPCSYVDANFFFDGLALVKKSKYGPWICIDNNGNMKYTLKYTNGDVYRESLMAVTNSTEWDENSIFGFVDRNGELAIPFYYTPYKGDRFIYLPRFNNGKAYVRYNGKNGWIDKTGKFTPEK